MLDIRDSEANSCGKILQRTFLRTGPMILGLLRSRLKGAERGAHGAFLGELMRLGKEVSDSSWATLASP